MRWTGRNPVPNMPHNYTTFYNLRLWLSALFGMFGILLVGITVWSIVDSRERTLDDARLQSSRLARSLEEHASRTMISAQQAMQPVVELVERLGGVDGVAEPPLYALMRDRIAVTPQIRGIIAIRSNGMLHAHGLIYPVGRVSLADRDYFTLHREDPGLEYLLSLPLTSRTDGKLLIPLTRRVSRPDGSFGGVILTGLEPDYFARFYTSLEMPEGSVIALYNERGQELLQFPGADGYLSSRPVAVAPARLQALAQRPEVTVARDLIGTQERLYAVKASTSPRLYVVVGVSLGQALAGWERERNQRLTLLAIALLALGLLFWMAMRQLRHAQESDRQLALTQFAVDQSPDFVLWLRQDLTVAYVNAVVCDRLRIARSDLIGHPISSTRLLADDVDWQQLLARTDQHLRIQFEAVLSPSRGERIPVEMVLNRLLFDGDTCYCVAARDISERRRGEAELRRHRDQLQQLVDERTAELRAIFAATPLAILMTVESRIRLVNPALEGMFGVAERDLLGMGAEQLFADFTGAQRFRDAAAAVLRGGGVFNDEILFRRCDGGVFWANVYCRAIDGVHPEIGTIALIEDISCRRRAEAQLKRSEELNRTIIETCADGFVLFDADLQLQLVNPAMRIMLGYDREDFASRFSSQALLGMPSGLQTPTAVAGWLRQADNGVEIVLPSRSGASIPVLVNRTALWDEQGAMRYVFAFYTNIAQQKAIEYALTEAKEAAEAASLAKSSFLASMSHELRTPMHAILSYSGLGLEKAESAADEQLRRYYERINVSGKRLLTLINDLLDLAKLEAGKMSYDLGPCRLQDLVEDALAEIRPLLDSRGLCLSYQPDAQPIALICDRNRIIQVLVNLLGNAAKFTPEGKSIYLGYLHNQPMRRGGIGAGIRLRDEGPGVALDELEAIFDKFTQGSTTHSQGGGTGLGLAICRDIVRDHGGEVYASNDPGGGAIFTLLLPAEN
mgnify:FL=1